LSSSFAFASHSFWRAGALGAHPRSVAGYKEEGGCQESTVLSQQPSSTLQSHNSQLSTCTPS
jgi:hypothetical protein